MRGDKPPLPPLMPLLVLRLRRLAMRYIICTLALRSLSRCLSVINKDREVDIHRIYDFIVGYFTLGY